MSLVLFLLLATAFPGDEVLFPGRADARDPSGRYAVVCVAQAGGARHELVLEDLQSGSRRTILAFSRRAAVLWAPDGGAVAVTDRERGSSSVRVFFPKHPAATADIGAELDKGVGAIPERRENSHVYLEAVRWLDARTLRFRLRGYGNRDPEGFDLLFDYVLGGTVRRATGLPTK